jgi:hypothetical protein
MPTKKDLAALLSETPQPPLRRGRGLRLSGASKQTRELAPKPSVSPEPSVLPEPSATAAPSQAELVADSVAVAETPIASDAVAAEADPVAAAPIESVAPPEREKRKIQLRKDLLKQAKRIARAQDRKLYQVIEAALEEYIQRHGATE